MSFSCLIRCISILLNQYHSIRNEEICFHRWLLITLLTQWPLILTVKCLIGNIYIYIYIIEKAELLLFPLFHTCYDKMIDIVWCSITTFLTEIVTELRYQKLQFNSEKNIISIQIINKHRLEPATYKDKCIVNIFNWFS